MDMSQIKKSNKVFFPLLMVILFYLFNFSSYRYYIPDESFYLEGNTSAGDVVVVVPYNLGRYISIVDGQIVSQYSSTITLYGNTLSAGNSQELQVRLSPFTGAEYRFNSNSGYSYVDFVINDIYDTNLPYLSSADFTLFSQPTLVNMCICLILGSIFVLILKKR